MSWADGLRVWATTRHGRLLVMCTEHEMVWNGAAGGAAETEQRRVLAEHEVLHWPVLTDSFSQLVQQRHLQHLRNRGLTPAYIDQRRRLLRGLERWAGRPLLELTSDDLDRWQTEALWGLTTARSRNNAVVHTGQFYRWARWTAELIEDERARVLVRAKEPRLVPRPITDRALAEALAQAPDRVRPMLYLAAYQGLRAVEIARLRREDIDEHAAEPTITVRGKGDKERTLPLSPRVWDELRAHGLPRRGPLFFMRDARARPTKQPVTARRVSSACNLYLGDIDADATLHQLSI